MSNFKRNGLLPFYKDDQYQDWQLSGYHKEYINTIQFIPRDTLVSFRTPTISSVITTIPTSITVRRLAIIGGVKIILDSTNYTVEIRRQYVDENFKTCLFADAVYTYYYFNQSTIDVSPANYLDANKIYEIYLEDVLGNKFISNIFVAIDETEIYINAEDGQIILDESGEGILFQ